MGVVVRELGRVISLTQTMQEVEVALLFFIGVRIATGTESLHDLRRVGRYTIIKDGVVLRKDEAHQVDIFAC